MMTVTISRRVEKVRTKQVLCLLALAALALPGAADRAEDLIGDLDHGAWQVRAKVAMALGEIGDGRTVDPLVEALKDDVREVRLNAARALGEIGDGSALDPLVRLASEDEVGGVREAAMRALERIGFGEMEI